MHILSKRWLIQGVLGMVGGVALGALLWLPWQQQAGRAVAVDAPVAWAASVISGTVAWKGTDTPVAGVRVVLRDPQAGTALTEAATDATGVYYLAAGVGDWIVDVPSSGQYWGYTQVLTAYPHQAYHLDFGITVRPAEPAAAAVQAAPPPRPPQAVPPSAGGQASTPRGPAPAAAPMAPAKLPPAGQSAAAPAKLPVAGQPTAPAKLPPSGRPLPWWLLGCLALALTGVGRWLRGRVAAGIPV